MITKMKLPDNPMDQRYPRYLYERFQFLPGEHTKYFNYKIEFGYYYRLGTIIAQWPNTNDAGANLGTDVGLDFVTIDRNRSKSNVPVSFKLISSPVGGGVVLPAPAPFDNEAFSVNMTADKYHNAIQQGEIYLFRSKIFMKITLQTVLAHTTYLDLLLRGYNEPEKEFSDNTIST